MPKTQPSPAAASSWWRVLRGLGHPVFERWAREAGSAEQCWNRFGREYEFGGHKAAFLAKESLEHHLILVSALPSERAKMCFFTAARTLPEALGGMGPAGAGRQDDSHAHGNLTLAVAK